MESTHQTGKTSGFRHHYRENGKVQHKDMPHLGLAGNAVSAMVNYELFVRPAIQKMMGKKNLSKPTIEAIIEDNIKNDDGRRVFARVVVEKRDGQILCQINRSPGFRILTSMASANGLAIVPEDKARLKRAKSSR